MSKLKSLFYRNLNKIVPLVFSILAFLTVLHTCNIDTPLSKNKEDIVIIRDHNNTELLKENIIGIEDTDDENKYVIYYFNAEKKQAAIESSNIDFYPHSLNGESSNLSKEIDYHSCFLDAECIVLNLKYVLISQHFNDMDCESPCKGGDCVEVKTEYGHEIIPANYSVGLKEKCKKCKEQYRENDNAPSPPVTNR